MRNLLFQIVFYIISSVTFIIFAILLIFKPNKFLFIKIYAKIILCLSKYIAGIKYDLPEKTIDYPCVIASSHSSNLEIAYLSQAVSKPIFVVKKELFKIPVFGYYLKRSGAIAVERDGSASDAKRILKGAKEALENNCQIIIFPQGTRQNMDEEMRLKDGIYFLYKKFGDNYPILPFCHNAGSFWHKDKGIIKSGKLTTKFYEKMKSGLQKEIFMNSLRNYYKNER